MSAENNGSSELAAFFDDIIDSQKNKLGGMLLKTYDSDIFNNWVQTDWIDGAGGITEITSIDITANDGKLTMDALNLQQKVYNMLNRIAVSGGTYRDWLETVYTASSDGTSPPLRVVTVSATRLENGMALPTRLEMSTPATA